MIQKILITIIIISFFLFGIKILNRINPKKTKKNNLDEDIVDLEKDPKTNEYRPKQK